MICATLENLELKQGQRCLFCLVSAVNAACGRFSYLKVYESEQSRARALKYCQRVYKLMDEVYFTFEIPIDVYLEKAEKYI